MTERDVDSSVVREAAERLLAWGFPAPAIAEQLHRSRSWIYAVRRDREGRAADTEETYSPAVRLLRDLNS